MLVDRYRLDLPGGFTLWDSSLLRSMAIAEDRRATRIVAQFCRDSRRCEQQVWPSLGPILVVADSDSAG